MYTLNTVKIEKLSAGTGIDLIKLIIIQKSRLINMSDRMTINRYQKQTFNTVEIYLPQPVGNILKELLNCGIKLGISSRGMGSVKKNVHEGTDEVQDDFELIAFDFVSNPSTKGAFMFPSGEQSLQEGIVKNPLTNKWEKVENLIRDILGEIK